MSEKTTLRILVICTGNSARSQMAEGLLDSISAGRVAAASAGSEPASTVHPLAIQAMQEIGIDISSHHPKPISKFVDMRFDYVIAVCGQAAESCPIFPVPAERLNWFWDDPAAVAGSLDEQLTAFRTIRDELQDRITTWMAANFW